MMEPPKMARCPHYQISSEALDIEGPAAYLAVRRCLLTERLIRLLTPLPEGKALAEKLVVQVQSGKAYAFVGPDLDAVTQRRCTIQRCEEHCTPSYIQHLEHFQVQDPAEEQVTCGDTQTPFTGEQAETAEASGSCLPR